MRKESQPQESRSGWRGGMKKKEKERNHARERKTQFRIIDSTRRDTSDARWVIQGNRTSQACKEKKGNRRPIVKKEKKNTGSKLGRNKSAVRAHNK